MSRSAAAGVFAAVAIVVYFVLVFAALIAGGGAVNCDQTCTPVQDFLNDAYPIPMLVGLGIALTSGALAARRARR